MGIALFWGIAIATYHGRHICVDVAVGTPGRAPAGAALDLLATAVTLAFLAPMAWMVWVKVRGTGTQATSDLRLPLVWFYAVSRLRRAWPPLLALRAAGASCGASRGAAGAWPRRSDAHGS